MANNWLDVLVPLKLLVGPPQVSDSGVGHRGPQALHGLPDLGTLGCRAAKVSPQQRYDRLLQRV